MSVSFGKITKRVPYFPKHALPLEQAFGYNSTLFIEDKTLSLLTI
jgi:hypothetical protein